MRVNNLATGDLAVLESKTLFPSGTGLSIRFKYNFFDSVGVEGVTTGIGDGFTLYLRKGSSTSTAIGAGGGAMGYAPNGGTGLVDGMVAVSFDAAGYFAHSVVNSANNAECPPYTSVQVPNRVHVRGGMGSTSAKGYCFLGSSTEGAISFTNGSNTRMGRARSARVELDPQSAPSPRMRVYYSGNASALQSELKLVLESAAPAGWLTETTAKVGFTATNGGTPNLARKETWDVYVESLLPIPKLSMNPGPLPFGYVGSNYSAPITGLAGSMPYQISRTGGALPPGLTLSGGPIPKLSGVPTAAGLYNFTVSVTDTANPNSGSPASVSATYTVRVYSSRAVLSGPFDLAVPFLTRVAANERPANISGVVRALYCDAAASLQVSGAALRVANVSVYNKAAGVWEPRAEPSIAAADFSNSGVDDASCVYLRSESAKFAGGALPGSGRRLQSAVPATDEWLRATFEAVVTSDNSPALAAAATAASRTLAQQLVAAVADLQGAPVPPVFAALADNNVTAAGAFPAVYWALFAAVPSNSPSPTSSASTSGSTTASASVSRSASASRSTTATVSVTRSVSASVTATATTTASTTATPSGTSSVSLTPAASPTNTRTGTMTPSLSPATVPALPSIDLSFTLVGGDVASLQAGSGLELRRALATLTGVPGANAVFTSINVTSTNTTVAGVLGLGNVSAIGAGSLNSTTTVATTSVVVSPTDPTLNGPARRQRRLQAACNPLVLPGSGAVTVPVSIAGMAIQIPPSYFTSVGAQTPEEMAAIAALLAAQLMQLLSNASTAAGAMGSFIASWSTCTGMPASLGVITGLANASVVQVLPVVASDENSAPLVIGLMVTLGAAFSALVICIAVCCRPSPVDDRLLRRDKRRD